MRRRWTVSVFLLTSLLTPPLWAGPPKDRTPPTTPVVTDDGAFTSSTSSVSARWTSADPESGIKESQYHIRQDSTKGKAIVGWTKAGTATSVTRTGLRLLHGKSYFFGVRAKNGAGKWSAIGWSDGIKVDTTPPSPVTVSDDGATTFSTTSLHARWGASSDPESGIGEYQYEIRQDAPSGPVIVPWTSVGLATEVTRTALSLTNGKSYYIGVKAKNGAGLFAAARYSDGILVKDDPPRGTLVINNNDPYTTTTAVTLTLSATDDAGPVAQMQFSNDGTTYSAPEPYATTKAWTLGSGDGTKTVWVKFKDASSNWSSPASDSIILDTMPPTTPVVRDDGQTTPSATQLHAMWSASDAGSGVAEYQYRITQDAVVGTVIVDWTSVGTATEVTRAGLELISGNAYYIGVRARDHVDHWSEVGSSDGITVALGAAAPILHPIGNKTIVVRSARPQAVKASSARSTTAEGTSPQRQEPPGNEALQVVPGEVIVKFKPGGFEFPSGTRIASAEEIHMTAESLQALATQFGLVSAERIFQADHRQALERRWGDLYDTYVLRFPPTVEIEAVVTAYRNDPHVVYAEPNSIVWIVKPEQVPSRRLLKPDR